MGTRHDLYFMLQVPDVVAKAIVRLQRLLNASYRGPSKPMAPDRLHTTLVPLGSYEPRIPLDVLRVSQSAGALLCMARFRVAFDTVQSRGPQHELGSVELAGHGEGVQALRRLHRQLANALRQMGWPEARLRRNFSHTSRWTTDTRLWV